MCNLLPKQRLDDGENNHFKFLTKGEYKQVLGNKHIVIEALENNTILLSWVPVLIKTEEDYEFAAMNSQYVLLEGSVDDPKSLSVFSCPLPSGGTKICLLYTSPSPRDKRQSRMPSSA